MQLKNENELFNFLTGRSGEAELVKRVRPDGTFYYVHPKVSGPLEKLQKLLETPHQSLEVASAYRSYAQQESIWNEKVEGKRPLWSKDEKHLVDVQTLRPEEIVQHLLHFSSIPGCSRHHWGTDFDIFDPTYYKQTSQKLLLKNEAYDLQVGPNYHLLQSFEEGRLQGKHFFIRPYEQPRSEGIQREAWHISYAPVSKSLQSQFSFEIFERNLQQSHFHLKEILQRRARYYFETFFLVSL